MLNFINKDVSKFILSIETIKDLNITYRQDNITHNSFNSKIFYQKIFDFNIINLEKEFDLIEIFTSFNK